MSDQQQLWTRRLEKRTLTPEEEQELWEYMSADVATGTELFEDAQVDALLRTIGRAPDTNAFVASVLRKLDSEPPVDHATGRGQTTSSSESSPRGVRFPEDPRNVARPPVPPPVQRMPADESTHDDPRLSYVDRMSAAQPKEDWDSGADSASMIPSGPHDPVRLPSRRQSKVGWQWVFAITSCTAAVVLISVLATLAVISNQDNLAEQSNEQPNEQSQEGAPQTSDTDTDNDADPQSGNDSKDASPGNQPSYLDQEDRVPPPNPQLTEDRSNNEENTKPDPTDPNDKVKLPEAPGPATDVADRNSQSNRPMTVATLTASEDAVWRDGSQLPSKLLAGELHLEKGNVEITMADGAVIRLVAPVDIQLDSPAQVTLNRGDLTGVVPPEAVGFVVQTPISRIVDLGTEFGVLVDENGATDVRVIRGEVEVKKSMGGDEGWNLGPGGYKWISADGQTDLDWRAEVNIDMNQATGWVVLNGEKMLLEDNKSFALAYGKLATSISRLTTKVRASDGDFGGEIVVNDRRTSFNDTSEHQRVRSQIIPEIHRLWIQALRNARGNRPQTGNGGVININGKEYRFNNFEEMMELQRELMRDLQNGNLPDASLPGQGNSVPRNDASKRRGDSNDKRHDDSTRRGSRRPTNPVFTTGLQQSNPRQPAVKNRTRTAPVDVTNTTKPKTAHKYGIRWADTPNDASQLASAEKKPIMWLRVLGDLDGFM